MSVYSLDMVLPPSHISGSGYRPTVRFSSTPTVYSGGAVSSSMNHNMVGGGSSKSLFDLPQINLSNWFSTSDGKSVTRIVISFCILGLLAWVLHRWFRSRLLEDAGYQPNCPTWLMGSPIPGTCSVNNKQKKVKKDDEDSDSDSDIEESFEDEKPKPKATSTSTSTTSKNNNKSKTKKTTKQVVLGKPHPMEQGARDVQSYTQLRSSYGPKEIPHEYATCLTTNPDNKKTCDFWKNLDAEPRPVRKLMRANDMSSAHVSQSSTYPMYEERIPQAMSSMEGFGNFAAVNFTS
jgi:hypothetical protein